MDILLVDNANIKLYLNTRKSKTFNGHSVLNRNHYVFLNSKQRYYDVNNM